MDEQRKGIQEKIDAKKEELKKEQQALAGLLRTHELKVQEVASLNEQTKEVIKDKEAYKEKFQQLSNESHSRQKELDNVIMMNKNYKEQIQRLEEELREREQQLAQLSQEQEKEEKRNHVMSKMMVKIQEEVDRLESEREELTFQNKTEQAKLDELN